VCAAARAVRVVLVRQGDPSSTGESLLNGNAGERNGN
jgi:hypothetical protein